MYMSATSSSDGAVEIAATFQQGTDPDIAAVEVQNRLKIVESRLPEAVRKEGVFVEKIIQQYSGDDFPLFYRQPE